MGIPVRELQSRVSSKDFTMYMALDRLDPFGKQRMDHGFGLVCSTLARVNGNDAKASDFMVNYDEPYKKKDRAKELLNKMMAFGNHHNKRKE